MLAPTPAFDPRRGLPFIRQFSPETYRAHAQIFATAQTADGVLYFGTYGHVLSYDGIRWQQFPVPGTWVRALAIGADGLVYVGGADTLGRLEPDPANGLLRFVSLAPTLPPTRRNFGTVWSLAALDGGMAFGLDGALLHLRAGTWQESSFPGERPALRTAGSRVFYHSGAVLHEWREGRWQPLLRDPRLAAVRRLAVVTDTDALLLALDDGRLLRLPAGADIATEWITPATPLLRRIGLRNAARLADDSLAISTGGEGVLLLAPDGTPRQRLGAAEGLTHDSTYGLFVARDHSLWVETANGLSQLDPAAPWSMFDARNGRPVSIGGDVVPLGSDLVFKFSDQAALRFRPAPDGLGAARFEILAPDLPTRLANLLPWGGHLLTGDNRGLLRLDRPDQILQPTSSVVEDVFVSQKTPGLVVAGLLRGAELFRLKPDGEPSVPLGRVPDFEAEVTNIAEADDGTVWLGTTAGYALRLRLTASGTLLDATRFGAAQGLPAGSGWVRVLATPAGLLVFVRDGLFTVDPTGERLIPHPAFTSVHPAGVNTLPLAHDQSHRYWFQTQRPGRTYELGCLDLRDPTRPLWTPLAPEIGAALGFTGARILSYRRDQGRELLWISGDRTTIRLELDRPAILPPPPGALITGLTRGSLRRSTRDPRTSLPFSREPVRFLLASPATLQPPVGFETRLLGYDSTWSSAPAAEAAFTNLSGGPFTLEVRTRDVLGRTGPVASTTFSVSPPWPRSPLAYVLYLATATAAVAGFLRWRLAHAARRQRDLETLVTTRTAELATARDAAESASRAKSSFLASMSHELRTPLNGVIGYAQVLQDDRRLLPDQRDRLRIVQNSGEHLLRMINDVLDLAKIEAGKLELRPAPFALAELVRDILAAHAPAAAAKNLALTTDLAPDLPAWIEGDAQKLRQVLDNLLGNAVKFTAAGSVSLAVRCKAGSPDPASTPTPSAPGSQLSTLSSQLIRFSVTDTGPGISTADRARLFQPFEQAHAARPQAPGAGLGLAISRALVTRLGGTLTLADPASGGPGTSPVGSSADSGSTFTFAIPLPASAPVSAPAPRAGPLVGYDGPPRHVLIVDDHAVNRSLLTDLLTPLDFICHEFPSGETALDALSHPEFPAPDLAILDVRMEGIDGLELTRRLRARPSGSSLKILLTSASVLTFDPAAGRAAGCDDFLPKPFRTADLIEKIGSLLALAWRETPLEVCNLMEDKLSRAAAPLPTPLRDELRALLAHGDLAAFQAALDAARPLHPDCELRLDELAAAASSFELSRLRLLLAPP